MLPHPILSTLTKVVFSNLLKSSLQLFCVSCRLVIHTSCVCPLLSYNMACWLSIPDDIYCLLIYRYICISRCGRNPNWVTFGLSWVTCKFKIVSVIQSLSVFDRIVDPTRNLPQRVWVRSWLQAAARTRWGAVGLVGARERWGRRAARVWQSPGSLREAGNS
jgi:hypothetical protein